MSIHTIYKICSSCNGNGTRYLMTGDDRLGVEDCPRCATTGVLETGTLDYGDNIFPSYQILEELDATEYAGLGAGAIAGIDTMLSCGLVDLNDGKAGKVRLWNWFGAESTTVANLTALLE